MKPEDEILEVENFKKEALEKIGEKLHKNYYCGSGKHTRKSDDFVSEFCDIADRLGIRYKKGNDAPRGGWEGEYLRIPRNQKSKLERIDSAIFLLGEKNRIINKQQRQITSFEMLYNDVASSGNRYRSGEKPTPDDYDKIPNKLTRINQNGILEFYDSENKKWGKIDSFFFNVK